MLRSDLPRRFYNHEKIVHCSIVTGRIEATTSPRFTLINNQRRPLPKMLPPDQAVLSQVFAPGDTRKTCRVCSAGHRDTYIFRKGWLVRKIVDVAPEVSKDLVAKGARACLCNRCGQAFRKRIATIDEHDAMFEMISRFAQDESDAVHGVGDVRDDFGQFGTQYEIHGGTSQVTGQPLKRQKSISYHASDDWNRRGAESSLCLTEDLATHVARSRCRPKTRAEMDALVTIAAASANMEPREYAGYTVTKTNTEGCHFTFFWIRKADTTEPLLVSVGHDKRKSGHFTYVRAPGLPDNVPELECTSRRQVLAWMLTHFQVANRQLNTRLRKDIPNIGAREAHKLAGLDQDGVKLAARRGGGAPTAPKTSTKTPTALTEKRPSTRCFTTIGMTGCVSSAGESEQSDTMDGALPSPFTFLDNLGMDVPSLSDLLMMTSPDVMPTGGTSSVYMKNALMSPSLPERLSEEPEMETIEVVGASRCCGACGLGNHKTQTCPLQRESGVSISISPSISEDGSGAPERRAGDRDGGLCTADGMLFRSSDLLDDIGCWTEVSSPHETEKLIEWEVHKSGLAPPAAPPAAPPSDLASLAGAVAVLRNHPSRTADDIALALEEIERSNLSLKELADGGITAIVDGLLSTSALVGKVADASRALCHKWLSQAQALQRMSGAKPVLHA